MSFLSIVWCLIKQLPINGKRKKERTILYKLKQKPVLKLKLSLIDSKPLIWRTIIVPKSTKLHGLHKMIQILMQWWDYHLYKFEFAGETYEEPDPDAMGKNSQKIRLGNLNIKPGESLTYYYDFGDGWEIDILVEAELTADENVILPWLIDGERLGPPEDCGGISGLETVLKACQNRQNEEYGELLAWLGDDYIPENFDTRTTNHFLVLASAWMGLIK